MGDLDYIHFVVFRRKLCSCHVSFLFVSTFFFSLVISIFGFRVALSCSCVCFV